MLIVRNYLIVNTVKKNMGKWLSGEEARNRLYEMRESDTFAVQTKVSYGVQTRYAVIVRTSTRDRWNFAEGNAAEPYNIIVKCECSRDPQREFVDSMRIAYDPQDRQLYLRKRIGAFDPIVGICSDSNSVDYNPSASLMVECDECGQTYNQPVSEDDLPTAGKTLIKTDTGDIITPCCRTTNWTTQISE